jgi:hypothetical protein
VAGAERRRAAGDNGIVVKLMPGDEARDVLAERETFTP